MKREVNYEDEDPMENANPWLDNGNAIDVGKRGGGKSVFNYFNITLFILIQPISLRAIQNYTTYNTKRLINAFIMHLQMIKNNAFNRMNA